MHQSYTNMQPNSKANPTPAPGDRRDSEVLLDTDLGRIALGLNLTAQLRLWIIGHELSRSAYSGRGWVSKSDLWDALALIDWTITSRHYRRLLSRGDGLFWCIHRDRIFLRSIKRVSEELCIKAGLQTKSLIETNCPGGKKSVWIPVSGSHERFEANIYAGWLAAHDGPTIARETLEGLFNRHQTTLRRWEKQHLGDKLNVVSCYATVNDLGERPAEHAFYDKSVKSWVFQLPNTYQAAMRQTPRDGQRRKIWQAVTPADYGVGGDTNRLYFATAKGMKRALDRTEDSCSRYCWLYAHGGRFYFRRSADSFA